MYFNMHIHVKLQFREKMSPNRNLDLTGTGSCASFNLRRTARALTRSLPAWRKVQQRFVTTVGAEQWKGLRNGLEDLAHTITAFEDPSKDTQARKPTSF